MIDSEFIDGLDFEVLKTSMFKFGIGSSGIRTKESAVEAIYDYFEGRDMPIEFQCGNCDADLPDINFCPFCASVLSDEEKQDDFIHKSKGIPKEFYRGARRGRLPKDALKISGSKLVARLIGVLGISHDYVRYRKSVTSLWCVWGLFAKCFVGAFSVRIHLPFDVADYDDKNDIVIGFGSPIKNMKSRVFVESFDEIEDVVDILKQSVLLKKKQSDRRKGKHKPNILPSINPNPKPPSRPKKPD